VGVVAAVNMMPEREGLPAAPLPPSGKWTGDSIYEHFTTRHEDIERGVGSRLGDLQAQIDRRIDTQARERYDTEKHLAELVQGLRREVETVNRETQRAVTEATQEREKAALALAESLRQTILEGQDRMREHVDNQVHQIDGVIQSLRREFGFANDAAQKAIDKAEVATDKRFQAVNAFREQLADQATRFVPREVADAENKDALRRIEANAEAIAGLRGTTLPRERFEATISDWTTWREVTDRRLSEQAGAARGITSSVGFIVAIAGVLLTVVIIVIGVLA
jgi:hypothetical protein